MALQLQCPNPACAKVSAAPDEFSGKSVRCKHCGQSFVASPTLDGVADDTRSSDPRPADPDPQVATVARFRVRARLGAGAFGTVYRAYDPQLDREVAVKVPNPGILADPRRVERFLREAKAAAQLRHPHIVPVFDAGKDGDTLYIASAFIHGRPLSETIDDTGTDFRRAAQVVRELAEALAYAHGQGVVHRDVKPDNVLVDGQDRVHLMDFGLAARQDEASKLTSDGAVMGTPSYMAPEQAAGKSAEAGPPADQYAAGVVLYELLTGTVPFEGPVAVVIHNVIHTPPDPPSKRRPGVPKDLETICLKAMAKQPEDRYADCQTLADDLRRWMEGEPIAARRLSTVERFTRWAKKNRALAAASLLAVIALTLGSILSTLFAISAGLAADRANQEASRADAEARRADEEASATKQALSESKANERTAKAEAKRADGETKRAEAEAQAAVIAAREAKENAERADAEKRRADGEAGAAKAALALSERNLAYSRLVIAEHEWNGSGSARAANQTLDLIPDRDRNVEWRLAKRRYQGGIYSIPGRAAHTVGFSPDGSRITAVSRGGWIGAWDAATGETLSEFHAKGDDRDTNGACFSPDGARVAIAVYAARPDRPKAPSDLGVWDAKTGAAQLALKGNEREVHFIRFSGDGNRVAAVDGPTIRMWDAKSGQSLVEIKGNVASTFCFSPDGSRLAAPRDGAIQVWDAKSGASVAEWKVPSRYGDAVCFSPDGSKLVGAGDAIRVWDARTGAAVLELPGHDPRCVCFSPDGGRLATGSWDGAVRVWDLATKSLLLTLKGHLDGVHAVSFSPDGTRIVSGSGDRTIRVWDAKVGTPVPELRAATQAHLQVAGYAIPRVSFGPDGNRLATACKNGRTVRVWDVRSGRSVLDINAQRNEANCVRFSPDGSRVAAAVDSVIRLLDAKSGDVLCEIKAGRYVRDMSFSPDGDRIAAGSDGGVVVWDAKTGQNLLELKGPTHGVSCVSFGPDGSRIAAGTNGKSVWVWDAKTGVLLKELTGHTLQLYGVCFSPDGRRIASASHDGTIRVWDATTWEAVHELKGHTGAVLDVAFTPDGSRIVSSSLDNTIRIWDATLGLSLAQLRPPGANLSLAAVSPDGNWLVSGHADGTIRVWDARPLSKPGLAPDETEVRRRQWLERTRQENLKPTPKKP